MNRIKILAVLFTAFQLLDFTLSYIGISSEGISFEKNSFAVYLIENFGVFSLLFVKSLLSAIALLVAYKYSKEYERILFAIYLISTIISLYGFLSAIYGLLFI